jgi:cob(I)alamin adenosyltransferase
MTNRLTKITTRTGDDGSTGLGDGTRIHKSAPRVQLLGDIDELNSMIGLVITEPLSNDARTYLTRIQNALFDLGGEICIPGHLAIGDTHVAELDAASAKLNAQLPSLKEFILPGGCRAAALCHVARTIARRAERSLVTLHQQEPVSPHSLQYLNRLSDFLFILARTLNRDSGVADVLWQRDIADKAA